MVRGGHVPKPPLDSLRGFSGFGGQAKAMILATVLEGVGNSFIWFLFTLYLEELRYTPGSIGIVLMIMGLTSTVPLLPAGYLGDRFGRKRMILLGICTNAFGVLLVILASSYWMFCAGSVFWGLGHSFYGPAFLALMSEKVGERRRKYLFSLQAFAGMVSGAAAIFAAGFLPEILSTAMGTSLREGFRATFWAGLVCVALQLPVIIPMSEERKVGTIDADGGAVRLPPIPWRTLLLLCLPMILLGIGAGLIVPFFQLYFVWRFNTPMSVIGLLFSLTHFFWGLAYLVMPYFADKVGSVNAITIVQWVAIVALIGIPISPSFHFVALMYLIRMVVMNSTWPILQSFSLGRVPKEHGSFTLSATNFSFNVPKGLSPGIAGFIFEFDLELPFFICAGFYMMATIMFFLAFRRFDDRSDNPEDQGREEE